GLVDDRVGVDFAAAARLHPGHLGIPVLDAAAGRPVVAATGGAPLEQEAVSAATFPEGRVQLVRHGVRRQQFGGGRHGSLLRLRSKHPASRNTKAEAAGEWLPVQAPAPSSIVAWAHVFWTPALNPWPLTSATSTSASCPASSMPRAWRMPSVTA